MPFIELKNPLKPIRINKIPVDNFLGKGNFNTIENRKGYYFEKMAFLLVSNKTINYYSKFGKSNFSVS